MGIRLIEASATRVVATMPVEGNTQPLGLLHGGASGVLAEGAASYGAAMFARETGRVALGVELNATHHRSAAAGWVTAIATPVHLGGSFATYEVVITDEQDRRVCTARVNCALVDARSEA